MVYLVACVCVLGGGAGVVRDQKTVYCGALERGTEIGVVWSVGDGV